MGLSTSGFQNEYAPPVSTEAPSRSACRTPRTPRLSIALLACPVSILIGSCVTIDRLPAHQRPEYAVLGALSLLASTLLVRSASKNTRLRLLRLITLAVFHFGY